MIVFRTLVLLLLLGSVGCFAAFVWSRNRLWLGRGVKTAAWGIGLGLAFFVVLAIERAASG
ncbi:MAG: hypothetical protein JWQ11_2285 [Rhizobacter sp.]|nr:hypothetical protein [Rhizobacter sp.]